MFYIHGSSLAKFGSTKANSGDYIAIDETLNEYVSLFFGKAKYGEKEVSEAVIEQIKTLNEEIAKLRNETENKIKDSLKNSGLEEAVLTEIEEKAKKDEKDFVAQYDIIEKDESGNFVLFSNSQINGKVNKYRLVSCDIEGKTLKVVSLNSTAKKRKPRTMEMETSAFINGEKVVKAKWEEFMEVHFSEAVA